MPPDPTSPEVSLFLRYSCVGFQADHESIGRRDVESPSTHAYRSVSVTVVLKPSLLASDTSYDGYQTLRLKAVGDNSVAQDLTPSALSLGQSTNTRGSLHSRRAKRLDPEGNLGLRTGSDIPNDLRTFIPAVCLKNGIVDHINPLVNAVLNNEPNGVSWNIVLVEARSAWPRSLRVSRLLRSSGSGKNLFSDLSKLNSAVNSEDFDLDRIKPLLNTALAHDLDDAILWDEVYHVVTESTPPLRPIASSLQQTPWLHSTSSLANSFEYRRDVESPQG
ncbi:hypothetical protein QBC46DRAFT_413396 [Diplogelasinospora grovesii]|uniref:Uncharacterized protein n=1 Tax=Diplogelasinospora grovesii TaxID=303347 RepID=A0AAN6MZD3_9PEZI|nr:hypothetical protein QBC46DRAFT_413396 [Diplogelasinospora grovesii]